MIQQNVTVKATTLDEAWLEWYKMLSSQNLADSSRDGEIAGEVINAVTVIEDPTKCIMLNDVRKMSVRYAVGELLWYMSANRAVKEIGKYTPAWSRFSDDGEYVNSNYGYCIKKKFGFDQYEMVKEVLSRDHSSRQAVIHIKEARDIIAEPTKDLNCTVCLQFLIREEKLYMTVYMRSNDIWMGMPFDMFNFAALQVLLSMELGVKLGTYTHIAGSLHLYKRNCIEGS